MKRIHIHIAVNELAESIGFYATILENRHRLKKKIMQNGR